MEKEKKKKPVRKKRKKNYLSNANLLEQLAISNEQDRMTHELAKMFMLLVERYASKIRFRVTESFKEDMKGFAITTLMKVWKGFNAEKSNNPFAYFTQCAKHAFYQFQNQEKKQKDIKNELLIAINMSPSYAYLADYEEAMRIENDSYEGQSSDSDYDVVIIEDTGDHD